MGFANLFDVLIFSMFWLIFSNGLIIFQLIDVSMFWLVFFNGFYWCVQCFSLFFFNVLFDFLRCFLLISFLVLIDVSMLWLILQCLVWFSSIFVIDLFNVLIDVFSSFDCIFQYFVLFFPRLNCFVNGFDSVFLIFYLLNILIDFSIVFIDLLNGFYWFVQCFHWFFNVLCEFLQCCLLICSIFWLIFQCFVWFSSMFFIDLFNAFNCSCSMIWLICSMFWLISFLVLIFFNVLINSSVVLLDVSMCWLFFVWCLYDLIDVFNHVIPCIIYFSNVFIVFIQCCISFWTIWSCICKTPQKPVRHAN